jgi:mono/diheme cytochrome c family protein
MSDAPHHDPESHDELGTFLSVSQFIVTAVILGAIGTLAYMAGLHAGGGGTHGGEGGGAATAAAAANADVATLIVETPELVAKGKTLYSVNCASCHGTGGAGDGAAAGALNPKPRDVTTPLGWKFGSGLARITRTLTEGSPGTAMAAFQAIPLPDRIALAHYVRSLNPLPDDDTQADLDWLGVGSGGGGAGAGPAATIAVEAGPTIPIDRALALLAESPPAPGAVTTPAAEDSGEGARLFAERCASCHGTAGQGGVRVEMLGSAPYAYVTTRSLGDGSAAWAADPRVFDDIVTRGLSGALMPGQGSLSRSALSALYEYTQTLRARQLAAGRGQSS